MAEGLRRTLWGVAPEAAREALSTQAMAHAARSAEAQRRVQEEAAEQERLRLEVAAARRRADALKGAVALLRQGLERELARSPLHQRALEQELACKQAEHGAKLQDLRFEEVRISAEISRQQEALRALAESLHRALQQNVTACAAPGQPVLMKAEPPPVVLESNHAPSPALPRDWADRAWAVEGRHAAQTLSAPDGRTIVRRGEPITAAVLADAERAGLLVDLLLSIEIP